MPENDNVRYRLILGDQILEDCRCGYYDSNLFCYLRNDMSFNEAFQYFSSPSKFETVIFEIEEEYYITKITYSGFDCLVSITKQEFDLTVRITGPHISINKERIVKERDETDGTIHNQDSDKP